MDPLLATLETLLESWRAEAGVAVPGPSIERLQERLEELLTRERAQWLGEAERARTAEAASRAELQDVFDNLPSAVYLTDANQNTQYASRAGLATLNAPSASALRIGRTNLERVYDVRDAQHGLPVPLGRLPLERALQGEQWRGDYIFRMRATGAMKRMRIVASPVSSLNGVARALLVLDDVTEERRAIEALERSEQNFRLLAEALPQLIWTATPDGLLDFANQRALDYFQCREEDLIGQGWQTVLHPDDIERCVASWERSLRSGDNYEIEFRLRRADGAQRWHLTRALPMRDDHGTIVRWFGTCTDIHDQKLVLDELEKRTQFEHHLMGIVSHDLRNPLTTILIGSQGLVNKEQPPDEVHKIALRIHGSAQRSVRMIRDLLDFTQVHVGGTLAVRRKPTDLYTLTRATLDELQEAAPERRIELQVTGDSHGDWDPDRLVQVVTNLLTNALRYSPRGGLVQVSIAGDAHAATLSVNNHGPLIGPEQLRRIFAPMQRATNQIDVLERSIGLGLYIVDAIARAHGGSVSVSSLQGMGTTFTVVLPRA